MTEKQLEANRENAKKSTGPKTAEGKLRSRLNAYRHGITGQSAVMPEEDLAAYLKFTNGIAASLDLEGPVEQQLGQSYASCLWRISRCAAMEETMFTLGLMDEVAENYNIEDAEAHTATSNAKTFRTRSDEFTRLVMYNQRLVSQSEKILKQLNQFQNQRRARENSEKDQAIAVYKAYKKVGAPFDPKADGFVLTIPRIEACLHRQNLADPEYIAAITRKTA